MKIVTLICRILLGAAFVFFGANILHPFMPMHAPPPDSLPGHYQIAMSTGWMKVVGAGQLIGGVLVLIGGTLPLGLCILCPITVNILCFHLFLTGGKMIGPGILCAVLELVLIYAYRESFAGIFSTSERPTG
ncbi:DoxX family protein [Granulicella cerasi]|uniref:DoxX family protein n=1 Tax=Granulicella cerasi TaxID=741063 RepID=A0ABW1ZB30_9BACT|nr:DoxX family protein [Granulicella cerasi]